MLKIVREFVGLFFLRNIWKQVFIYGIGGGQTSHKLQVFEGGFGVFYYWELRIVISFFAKDRPTYIQQLKATLVVQLYEVNVLSSILRDYDLAMVT